MSFGLYSAHNVGGLAVSFFTNPIDIPHARANGGNAALEILIVHPEDKDESAGIHELLRTSKTR